MSTHDEELSVLNERLRIKGLFKCFVEEQNEYDSFELIKSLISIYNLRSGLSRDEELEEHIRKCGILLSRKKATRHARKWIEQNKERVDYDN